tara:strand:- start:3410 stop:4453 length:1044 start_codon:yes stop_codon:yes gene_type:complete
MAKEESKLVDEVVESTETNEIKEGFNPLAFTEDNYGEIAKEEETEGSTETQEETQEEKQDEEKTETEEQKEEEDGWSWEAANEKEEEVKEEETYNWEGKEEKKEESPTKEEALTWAKVGKELGIEINTRDEFVNVLNSYSQELQKLQTQQSTPNSQVAELRNYLSFSDRDLVAEELKADGIEESEIEESLDKLEDNGMMKMKAKSIRRVLNNAIDQQVSQSKKQEEQKQVQQQQQKEQARTDLKNEIKNMNEFMGGKVTKKQKEEVYRYATNNMMKDIYASHANVAEVAMFMLYRKQIEKILRSQGLEDGKAAIMDSIVSPSLNTGKSKSNFKVKTGKFDPKAFISE